MAEQNEARYLEAKLPEFANFNIDLSLKQQADDLNTNKPKSKLISIEASEAVRPKKKGVFSMFENRNSTIYNKSQQKKVSTSKNTPF